MSQAEREITFEVFFEGCQGANNAARRGIGVNTCGTRCRPALHTRRDSMTTLADLSTAIDLPDCYGRIEEASTRRAARQRRRAACKKENGSTRGGDRSNLEGDRHNPRGDAD